MHVYICTYIYTYIFTYTEEAQGAHGTRDTAGPRQGEQGRRRRRRTRARVRGQEPGRTRRQLCMHVTHDTNTEHDFPVRGSLDAPHTPQAPITRRVAAAAIMRKPQLLLVCIPPWRQPPAPPAPPACLTSVACARVASIRTFVDVTCIRFCCIGVSTIYIYIYIS